MKKKAMHDVLAFFSELHSYSDKVLMDIIAEESMECLSDMRDVGWTINGVIAHKFDKSHQDAFEDAYNHLKEKLNEQSSKV